jgi:hypothetical protein
MHTLLQYGGVGSGTLGEFVVAIVALVGALAAVLLVGKLFERFF